MTSAWAIDWALGKLDVVARDQPTAVGQDNEACYNCPDNRSMAKFKQAGAIVVRAGKSEPRILLVTARRNPSNWIFPKGHVETGETLMAAAVREAREEAGVEGQVVGRAGKMTFEFGDNTYRVHYFVVRTGDSGKEREGRRLRWVKYKQALRQLSFDETRDLLREAWPRIRLAVATGSRGSRKKK